MRYVCIIIIISKIIQVQRNMKKKIYIYILEISRSLYIRTLVYVYIAGRGGERRGGEGRGGKGGGERGRF